MNPTTRRLAALLALTLALPSPTFAYRVKETSSGAPISWAGDAVTFDVQGITYLSADWNVVYDAVATIDDSVVGIDIDLAEGDGSPGLDNGDPEIIFSTDSALTNGSSARCVSWYDGDEIDEADVVIDPTGRTDSEFKADVLAYGGSRSTQLSLLHEVGHCIGLDHETRYLTMMGDNIDYHFTNGDYARYNPGEDLLAGAASLYGRVAASEVAVSHFKRTGDDGEYSEHGRTGIYDPVSGTLALPSTTYDGEPMYIARAGESIKVEFSYENMGNTTVSPTVNMRWSTNDTVTPFDTLLDTFSPSMALNQPYTTKYVVTIPEDAAAGRYWVGPELTPLSGELVLTNNATYTGVEVVDLGDWDFCSPALPCHRGEGDCDTDSDCQGSATCSQNVGADYGLATNLDVCELPEGDWDYCTPETPCAAGMGDCDTDADCISTRKFPVECSQNVGASYGFASSVDVCERVSLFN